MADHPDGAGKAVLQVNDIYVSTPQDMSYVDLDTFRGV
jgi:hypothetical protein